jgi:NADH:ubiquinone oxidoreductase subunit 3 (subunit A)
MTLDTSDLAIKLLISLAFVLSVVVFIIIVSVLSRTFRRKEKKPSIDEAEIITKKAKISGKQFNQFYQNSVYFLIFIVFSIFLLLSFSIFQDDLHLVDLWPFLFFIAILILYCLSLIEKQKTRSKRTIQRDMRKL